MIWPIKEYDIENLYLDQYNIRTPISDQDQNALIQDMFANESAFDIVRSFVQNGIFPDEFPIVVKENSKLIMIEGNRRLAALKALKEPHIVPSWQKKIEALNNPHINKIPVVLAPNRESAIKHIANKHTVDYRRPWRPLRQAYFYKSQLDNGKSLEEITAEFPEHNIPRFIKMLEIHHMAKSVDINDALKEKVHDERGFPITTLERFYDDKTVASFLGIGFDDLGKVKGNIDKQEFEKGFKKIIEDIATGIIDSRKFNTTEERRDYINKLPDEYQPDLSKKGAFGTSDFKPVAVPQSKTKTTQKLSKKIPTGLFFQGDVPYNLSNSSLRIIYNELKDINVYYFPNATHDLLRSFLECSLVYYLKETNEYQLIQKSSQHNPRLSELLTFVASAQCKSITDNNIKQTINQFKQNWADAYSLERLNMTNHNENWNTTETEVRSTWAKLEGFFKIILNPKIYP
jgi:hypothetical protein